MACLVGLVWALPPALASAKQIYFYRDRRGVMHFTDAPTDTRYRLFQLRYRVTIGSGGHRIDPKLLEPYISVASKRFKLDPALVKAVIQVESAFDPYAVSWAGAKGLMQLMPETADLMGVANIFGLKDNIDGGSRYLRLMLDRFKGDLNLALAAYNIGPERVAREKRVPDVRETRMYVQRVLQYYRKYKKP